MKKYMATVTVRVFVEAENEEDACAAAINEVAFGEIRNIEYEEVV